MSLVTVFINAQPLIIIMCLIFFFLGGGALSFLIMENTMEICLHVELTVFVLPSFAFILITNAYTCIMLARMKDGLADSMDNF